MDFRDYDGRYVGCNPVEVGKAAEARIAVLEDAIKRAVKRAEGNGMGHWPVYSGLRKALEGK